MTQTTGATACLTALRGKCHWWRRCNCVRCHHASCCQVGMHTVLPRLYASVAHGEMVGMAYRYLLMLPA